MNEPSAEVSEQNALAQPPHQIAPSRQRAELSKIEEDGESQVPSSTEQKDDVEDIQDKWRNLQNLKNLLNAGFISKTEYLDRKSQLIDDLTGTTTRTTKSSRTNTRKGHTATNLPIVVPRPPPDFSEVQAEKAIKYVFDIDNKKWHSEYVYLKLDPTPFSRGALRFVYHMKELRKKSKQTRTKTKSKSRKRPSDSVRSDGKSDASVSLWVDDDSDDETTTYVAKLSIDPRDQQNREVYFRDVEMQTLAKYYANKFNEYNPPKKIDFVKAWIFELVNREGRPICGVERFIHGPYRKHNNNYGYVSEEERNTPQAFSHFTYEASNHKVLIIDIQGVGDMYTDPQVHSMDGNGFGKGNMGQKGIDKFLQTHRCNAICRYLKLPAINANYSALGTLPVTQYMSYKHISVVNIANQVSSTTPLLPPKIDEDASCCDKFVEKCVVL